jgi:hypothetical protein
LKRSVILLVLLAIAACSTSTLKVSSDFDKRADFTKYRTWAWKDDGSIRDPVWSKRIQSTLADELEKKGLKRTDENPDLWAVVHARFSSETQVTSFSPAWGYGWGYWGAPSLTTIYEIPVGTVIIDLADVQRKELVWRCTASDTIRAGKEHEEREQKFIEVLAQMFAGYPPGSR